MATNFFYKSNNRTARVYNQTEDSFKTIDYSQILKMTNETDKKKDRMYFMFKGYEPTDEGLKQYANDFDKWVKELKNNDVFKFDYKAKFKSHNIAVEMLVKMLCKKELDEFEDIDTIESMWIEKCPNNGQQYCKEGKYECSSYDFRAFYGSNMSSSKFVIPTKRGKEQTIDKIDTKSLLVGYYHVQITSNDEAFKKIFTFSKYNVYTDISLLQAFQAQRENMKVNIELVKDDKPNAYIYGKHAKDGITNGYHVFGTWFKVLMSLKNEFPKNKIVKFLLSGGWGYMCKKYKHYLSIEELDELDDWDWEYNPDARWYVRNDRHKKDGTVYYEMIDTNQIYKYNCARMKPFLLARGRYITDKIALLHIEDVVRIHTDSVTFKVNRNDVCEKYTTFPELIPEDKSSGLIEWYNVNTYYNHTTKEKHGKIKKDIDDMDDDEFE